MSYILDALKKAERERHLGSVPTLHDAPEAVAARRFPSALPLFGALAVLLLIGWLLASRFWGRVAEPIPASQHSPASNNALVPPVPAAQTVAMPPAEIKPAAKIAAKSENKIETKVKTEVETKVAAVPDLKAQTKVDAKAENMAEAKVETKPETKTDTKLDAKADISKPAAEPAKARTDDQLPLAGELPEALRRDLPQLTVKGIIYSATAADRLLLTAGGLFHEGDEIAPGVRLERLYPKYAVCRYKDVRYRLTY